MMEERSIADGFHWFTSERASAPAMAECRKGELYCTNEIGPVTLVELKRRGWDYHGPVASLKDVRTLRKALKEIAGLDKHSGASLRQRAASEIARAALSGERGDI